MPDRALSSPLDDSFERYLQDKGKGRGGDGGNYPAQLSSFFGDGTLDLFAGAGIGGGDGLLVLPLFFLLTGIVLVFTGLPLLRGAYVSLKMRQPNTDLLVTTTVVSAYVYSTVAFLLVGSTSTTT